MGDTAFGVEWLRLLADSGAGAMVLDHDGKILYINDAAARIFTKRPAAEARGTRLADALRAHAAEERIEIGRRVIGTGHPVQFNDLWAGVAMRASVRKLDSFAGASGPAALWVFAPESAAMDAGTTADAQGTPIAARHVDLGRLSGLTNSELKVLALIGEGLSNAEIAARLHRAVKTVESHRASLTEKTGSSSRVELGMMARRAGLIRRLDIPASASPTKASPVPSFG